MPRAAIVRIWAPALVDLLTGKARTTNVPADLALERVDVDIERDMLLFRATSRTFDNVHDGDAAPEFRVLLEREKTFPHIPENLTVDVRDGRLLLSSGTRTVEIKLNGRDSGLFVDGPVEWRLLRMFLEPAFWQFERSDA